MKSVRFNAECDCTSWYVALVRYVRMALAVLGFFLCLLSVPSALAQANAKNVLIIYGSTANTDQGLLDLVKSRVRAQVSEPVNFHVVYLDYQRLKDKFYRESLAETLRRGYGEVKPDLQIVVFVETLQFVMENRDEMFPGVPIVFMNVSASELEGLKMLPGMTGLTGSVGLRGTIDLALRLHPDADAVAVITDAPGFWWAAAHSELLRQRRALHRPSEHPDDYESCRAPSPYSGLVSARATRFNRASSRSIRCPRVGRTAGTDLFRVGDAMSEPWVHRRSVP